MTNFVKYGKEIWTIIIQNKPFGVCDNEIKECIPEVCPKCKFNDSNCPIEKIKWLYEEAASIPAQFLTKKERAFCEIAKFGYIARDKDGTLVFYWGEPIKYKTWWEGDGFAKTIDGKFFNLIKWEDEKPWSIEELLKLEVE